MTKPNGSERLPAKLPALREPEAWEGEATRDEAADAVTTLISELGAEVAGPQETFSRLVQAVARRGYSPAELSYAAQELLYDEQLDRKLQFDGQLTPADFERVIRAHRQMRKKLRRLLEAKEVNDLVNRFPDQLSLEDFGIGGYNSFDEPLYRFKRDPSIPTGEPTPRLELNERPGQHRVRPEEPGQPKSTGEAVRGALEGFAEAHQENRNQEAA